MLPFGKRRHSSAAESAQTVAQPEAANAAPEAQAPVNILRFLRPECIRLDLLTEPTQACEDENEAQRERRLTADKERLCQELSEVLDASGHILNPTKFYKDMVHRERKATTAIVPGIAIPHVRSQQVREFVMGFARSDQGMPFASLDGQPTRLFFLLAAPPWDDKMYLKVYREFAEMIRHEWVVESFLDAETPQDVLNILRGYVTS